MELPVQSQNAPCRHLIIRADNYLVGSQNVGNRGSFAQELRIEGQAQPSADSLATACLESWPNEVPRSPRRDRAFDHDDAIRGLISYRPSDFLDCILYVREIDDTTFFLLWGTDCYENVLSFGCCGKLSRDLEELLSCCTPQETSQMRLIQWRHSFGDLGYFGFICVYSDCLESTMGERNGGAESNIP